MQQKEKNILSMCHCLILYLKEIIKNILRNAQGTIFNKSIYQCSLGHSATEEGDIGQA